MNKKYPCIDCSKLRTKEEGGTTFSVCDECWDKRHPLIEIRDQKSKESLIKYIQEHPELRLWQSIRNWSDFDFIYKSNTLVEHHDLIDTFYIEADKEL